MTAARGRTRQESDATTPTSVVAPQPEDWDGVADASRLGELRCAQCGYRIVVSRKPDSCPMCQNEDWVGVPWQPFTAGADGPS